ncbi:predicted protein [Chaetomium globosum CBS 148.51]|uniref:Uncharacterized protein n=1 Tax=Chaetomium globosum (strain ATCC 6205 / CBS 148.51 / DSM 1962 / NBRC 6347 / NRRL 1970) TaxID=306901 RepID=Q2HEG0_CHAGB|nr:uncharacterized protein CHGG_01394 [Chaetomium globosum CBS 148.51]EAQ93159.1 predicted protein [Chaetomium globosum CBS 148.51]
MHHAAAMPLFSSLLLLAGLAAAAPVVNLDDKCESQTICVDAINTCGIKYGGCYDVCDLSAKPVAPPCPTTTKKPPVPTTTKVITKVTTLKPKPTTTQKTTKKPTPTTTKKTTKKPTHKPTTKKPTPTPTKKPTPKPTSTKKPHPTTTKKPTVKPPVNPDPDQKLHHLYHQSCQLQQPTSRSAGDGINECGIMYGG